MAGIGTLRRLIYRVRRRYRLRHGLGRAMRDAGASVAACPHCGRDTPVYRSEYGRDGMPLSFTRCLWCGGLVEYDEAARAPHEPYANAAEIRTTGSDR